MVTSGNIGGDLGKYITACKYDTNPNQLSFTMNNLLLLNLGECAGSHSSMSSEGSSPNITDLGNMSNDCSPELRNLAAMYSCTDSLSHILRTSYNVMIISSSN